MKKGDEVLFYHSNEGVEIVGIAKLIKEYYQDPTTDDQAWVAVDLKPVRKLKKSVPLEIIKKDKRLVNMDLVRLGRLSVQTVKTHPRKKNRQQWLGQYNRAEKPSNRPIFF